MSRSDSASLAGCINARTRMVKSKRRVATAQRSGNHSRPLAVAIERSLRDVFRGQSHRALKRPANHEFSLRDMPTGWIFTSTPSKARLATADARIASNQYRQSPVSGTLHFADYFSLRTQGKTNRFLQFQSQPSSSHPPCRSIESSLDIPALPQSRKRLLVDANPPKRSRNTRSVAGSPCLREMSGCVPHC